MTAVVTITQVFETPERHPYFCAKCLVGSGSDRTFFVHTGIEYDYEGVVYLCNSCLTEICVQTRVLFTREQMDGLVEAYQAELQAARENNNRYTRAVGILRAAGIDLEALVERLYYGDRSSEAPVEDRGIIDSEPVTLGSEPDVADDDEQSLYLEREPDVHHSGPNPLLSGFKLDFGSGTD